jgi:hypothetical protein
MWSIVEARDAVKTIDTLPRNIAEKMRSGARSFANLDREVFG